jgi:molybdate-binding protein
MATLVIKEGEKPYIEDIWNLDDFRNVADGYDTETFTDEELIQAMERVADRFDANLGITWDTIEAALDFIAWERRRKNDNDSK